MIPLFGLGLPFCMMTMALGCGRPDIGVSAQRPILEAALRNTEGVVLLVSTGDAYVPLACWTSAHGIREADECLDLVSVQLQLENGAHAQIRELVPVYACDATPEERPQQHALRLDSTNPMTGRSIATWPSLSALHFRSLSPTEIDETRKAEEAVLRLAPGLTGDLRQETWTIDIDIDGDGEGETFYSLVVPSSDPTDPGLAFSALFIDDGDTLRLLRRFDYEVATFRAILDIDGDGSPELLMETSYYEGHSLQPVTVHHNRLEVLAAWSCGA